MKRHRDLYKNICKLENIKQSYKEVMQNTRNERRVFNMKQYQSIYTYQIYKFLINRSYKVGPYNKFIIYEPKERQIVSQSIIDKVINHLVARYILYPALMPSLLDINVASRPNMGTKAGLFYAKEYHRKCKVNYNREYYILKCDISKFFASINHDILKVKLLRKIKDKEALKIVFDIIDSNSPGLYIGSMANQALAIFFLSDTDYFIKEKLKIKYYVRYQDDFILFHQSKEYLKYCLEEIKQFLKNEKLSLNKKTRIYKSSNNYCFLGRNPKGKYIRYRNVKRKLKARYRLYQNNKIDLNYKLLSKLIKKGKSI